MTKKALNMLGLCVRSGNLITGESACERAVKREGAYLLVVDEGASVNAQKAMKDASAYADVPILFTPAGALGNAIGKPGRMAAAVMDQKLAARIIELSQETENNRGCL